MKWWHLRPILPPSALDDPAGLREVKEWMDAAADEIERLREALRPFADKYLWPDDAGEYVTNTVRDDEYWNAIANDETVDDVWIKRGDIRRARAALGEEK